MKSKIPLISETTSKNSDLVAELMKERDLYQTKYTNLLEKQNQHSSNQDDCEVIQFKISLEPI